jgi:hypothetical protein
VSELRPILGDRPTEAERRLLRSARLDVPPASGKGRALAAVGLAAAMTTTAGTGAATAATVTAGVVAKWITLGAVGSAIAFGVVEEVRPTVRDAPRLRSPLVGAPAVMTASHPATPLPEPSSSSPVLQPEPAAEGAERADRDLSSSGSAAPAPLPERVTRRPPSIPPAALPPSNPGSALPTEPPRAQEPADRSSATGATLAAEVNALDDARRALSSGDAEGALRSLDAYDHQFARRRLGLEATVLRIESLVVQGRLDRAREIARALLAAEPDGPYAQRVRSLLGDIRR